MTELMNTEITSTTTTVASIITSSSNSNPTTATTNTSNISTNTNTFIATSAPIALPATQSSIASVVTATNNENINISNNKRNVSVIHQILVISNIDFESESIYGFTELTLSPNPVNTVQSQSTENTSISSDFYETVSLNLKQCKVFCVCFNGNIDTDYEYCDPSLVKPCNDETKRDLQSLLYQDELGRLAVDADVSNGELCIQVPESIRELLRNGKNVKLAIEFYLEKPKGGIRFVLNRGCDEQINDAFLYTIDNGSHFWFPCLNSYNQQCTWKIEVTANEDFNVIASGNLIETETINLKTLESMETSSSVLTAGLNETNKKKYHFYVSQPTCAPNIGLVIGRFESETDENINEIVYYCESTLMELVKSSVTFMSDAFEFYEDFLGRNYPHNSSFKIVFVYDCPEDCFHYSNLAIVNVCLLHSNQIIDQTFITRKVLVNALARQYFGCFVTMFNWHSWWLLVGLAAHLANSYLKKILGNNEYKYIVYQEMKEVCQYEKDHGYILLDLNFNEANAKETTNKCYILLKNPLIASLNYLRIAEKKARSFSD